MVTTAFSWTNFMSTWIYSVFYHQFWQFYGPSDHMTNTFQQPNWPRTLSLCACKQLTHTKDWRRFTDHQASQLTIHLPRPLPLPTLLFQARTKVLAKLALNKKLKVQTIGNHIWCEKFCPVWAKNVSKIKLIKLLTEIHAIIFHIYIWSHHLYHSIFMTYMDKLVNFLLLCSSFLTIENATPLSCPTLTKNP